METQCQAKLESETGFRMLFQNAIVGIVLLGPAGDVQLMNPHARQMFGYSDEACEDLRFSMLVPEGLCELRSMLQDGAGESVLQCMTHGADLFARRKNGRMFPVTMRCAYYTLGEETLTVAFINDLTGLREAEEAARSVRGDVDRIVAERTLELTQALAQQRELNEMKSRFVSMASHEFRTPLSSVMSSASLLGHYTGAGNDVKRKKHVDRIISSVRNMTGILNEFLSLDKLEQGKTEIETGLVNLSDLGKELIDDLQGIIKPGQRIVHEHHGDLMIFQDGQILYSILLNLLSNAVKYSAEKTEITLTSIVRDDRVMISVADAGIGIPEDEQKQLFSKFFRARNVHAVQGTGLGLNIVMRYVELINGSIRFQSVEGVGTTFFVEFPLNYPE